MTPNLLLPPKYTITDERISVRKVKLIATTLHVQLNMQGLLNGFFSLKKIYFKFFMIKAHSLINQTPVIFTPCWISMHNVVSHT